MYDLPELRSATDAWWQGLRERPSIVATAPDPKMFGRR